MTNPHATEATPEHADAALTMNDFYIAMSHGDVRPYAQPVVELGSGRLIGYQGLARWHHRRLGTLDAVAFIDLIAETPLANEVDLYVVAKSLPRSSSQPETHRYTSTPPHRNG